MGQSKQEILNEIARWEQETGHRAEDAHKGENVVGMTDERRAEGVELWERYTEAWKAEQKPPTKGLGTSTEAVTCPSCQGSGESNALKAGPPGPCRFCGGTGVMKP